MADTWQLDGIYFEACNCDAACPCVFLSPPTEGECTVVIGWHIDRGRLGDTSLDGLSIVRAIHTPGPMLEVEWTAALYIDERGDAAQTAALEEIFTGKLGGSPSRLASHIGTDLGARRLPIEFRAEGGRRSVSIPGVVEAHIAAIAGQNDGEVAISGHPLCVAPGHPAVVARSSRLDYRDHGMDWQISDKTGFFSPFSYAGP
jgi:hypothetical protein